MIDFHVLDLANATTLIFLSHVIANAGIAGICICRLGQMHRKVLFRVRVQYIALLVAAVGNGMSTLLFRQYPSTAGVVFTSVVLFMLWSDSYQWKKGLPESASSDFAPLEKHNAH